MTLKTKVPSIRLVEQKACGPGAESAVFLSPRSGWGPHLEGQGAKDALISRNSSHHLKIRNQWGLSVISHDKTSHRRAGPRPTNPGARRSPARTGVLPSLWSCLLESKLSPQAVHVTRGLMLPMVSHPIPTMSSQRKEPPWPWASFS